MVLRYGKLLAEPLVVALTDFEVLLCLWLAGVALPAMLTHMATQGLEDCIGAAQFAEHTITALDWLLLDGRPRVSHSKWLYTLHIFITSYRHMHVQLHTRIYMKV